MTYEKSCGALVFRKDQNGIEYVLMIRHRHGGHRSFPKGHVEEGETEHETAIREVFEETGVSIEIYSPFRHTVSYSPAVGVIKKVVYFIADTTQEYIRPREGEIAEVEWVESGTVESKLTHENDKSLFRAAMAFRRRK